MKTPYTFDGPYKDCYIVPDVAMDPRHVYMVHEVLKSYQFKNALELGSFYGASSTAFVEAINAGHSMQATFCDIELSSGLRAVASDCVRDVRLTNEPSFHVLESSEDFDFILVDACHDIESVTLELERLMIRKPLCVMAHDTNAMAAGYPAAEGAAMLASTFKNHPDYFCVEDIEDRPGEQTKRGLFLATTDYSLYQKALGVFAELSQ
jgi:predicted O-methyltransferase YrrM